MSAPVPPQNLEAEESVLGAMMLSPSAITTVSDILRPGDFYRDSHGVIFKAALDLDARNEPVDALTLANYLDQSGKLKEVGGSARIHELATLMPVAGNVGHYAKIVREQAVLRNLVRCGQELTRLGHERPGSTEEILGLAESMVANLGDYATQGDFEAIGSDLDSFYDEIAAAVESGKPIFGLKSGFPDLDRILSGLHPGQMIVLAARPSVGKSLLGQNIAENVADQSIPAAIFSLEMSKREIQIRAAIRRCAAQGTRIDPTKLRTGRITTDELAALKKAIEFIEARPLYVEDNPAITMTELRARARRLKKKSGLGLLVVDYLQLMVGGGNAEHRQAEVAQISRQLKLLAKELGIPVIAISQLSRKLESREDKRPILSDLRESGAIEQDGDVILFLYRESLYREVPDDKKGDVELIVAKNRMGETDTVRLLFLGRRQTFATPALPGGHSVPDAA